MVVLVRPEQSGMAQMNQDHVGMGKHALDIVAVAGVPASLFDSPHLPGIYTFLGCIWIGLRILEWGYKRIRGLIGREE